METTKRLRKIKYKRNWKLIIKIVAFFTTLAVIYVMFGYGLAGVFLDIWKVF